MHSWSCPITSTASSGYEAQTPQSGAVGARHASPLRPAGPAPQSLGAIVGSFKSAVTRELRLRGLHDATPLWQRNYYERIIRNEAELTRIREYIAANPMLWDYDHENPIRTEDADYEQAWAWLESGH
jgi:REP-associated tyrosine transposase